MLLEIDSEEATGSFRPRCGRCQRVVSLSGNFKRSLSLAREARRLNIRAFWKIRAPDFFDRRSDPSHHQGVRHRSGAGHSHGLLSTSNLALSLNPVDEGRRFRAE